MLPCLCERHHNTPLDTLTYWLAAAAAAKPFATILQLLFQESRIPFILLTKNANLVPATYEKELRARPNVDGITLSQVIILQLYQVIFTPTSRYLQTHSIFYFDDCNFFYHILMSAVIFIHYLRSDIPPSLVN